MTALAGQYLNITLRDLVLNKNLQVNRKTQPITVTAGGYGPFPLESDYLRTYDLFYPLPVSGGLSNSSSIQFLAPITMEQFDAEFKSPSISNYPYEFANDLSIEAQTWTGVPLAAGSTLTSAGQMFIYPQTSGTIVLTHRYMVNRADIVTPETNAGFPWFPFEDYLIHATAARLMGITGDDRQDKYFAEAAAMLKPHLIMEGDEQETVHNIQLDPRRFKFHRNLRATKASPF